MAHTLPGNDHIQELPFLPSGAMAYVSGIEAPFQDELGRSTPGPGEDQVPLAGFVNNKAGSARKIECVAASLDLYAASNRGSAHHRQSVSLKKA